MAYLGRGAVYSKLGIINQAISDFDNAIKILPNHKMAYYERGLAYSKLGNQRKAIDDMEIAALQGVKEAQDFLKSKGLPSGETEDEKREMNWKKMLEKNRWY